MSTSRDVAEQAGKRLYGDGVEVLQFSVPRSQLEALSGLSFQAPSASWADFTRFHKTFGPTDLMHGGAPYDFVSGPMVQRITSKKEVLHWEGKSQFSIHSATAVDLFNSSLR